ncbi:MAG: hypothetical protein ACSLE1_11860 [Sphingobium sp.]
MRAAVAVDPDKRALVGPRQHLPTLFEQILLLVAFAYSQRRLDDPLGLFGLHQ